jgi:putative membrane protein
VKLLLKWIVLTASIFFVSYVLDGVKVDNFFTALFAAAVLGILNSIVRPVLIILTLPINFLTFGIFTFIINAALLMLVSVIIPGFHIDSFWTAVWGSILISITNALLNLFLRENRPPPPRPTGVIDLQENEKGRWE